MIYLSSDHGGFEVKQKIKNYLEKNDLKYVDLGPLSFDKTDDYPLYAQKLGEAIATNNGKGIGVCTTGVGMTIALNKVDGVRAAEVSSPEEARMARLDDDTNALVFGASTFDTLDWEKIIETWLNTKFSGEDRHIRRVEEIKQYEEQH